MRRLEYVCTACGRPFGRYQSAMRHLLNPNIHDGRGTITSLTEFALGVDEARYKPQSYNNGPPRISQWKKNLLPQSGLQNTTTRRETFYDQTHRWAQFTRDCRDITENITWMKAKTAEMSRLNPLPEFLFGYYCDKCFTTTSVLVPSLDHNAVKDHKCNPERVRKFECLKDKEELIKSLRKNLVKSLKSRIDGWTKNTGTYLIAIPISHDYAERSMPPYVRKLVVEFPQDSRHYLNRAISSMSIDSSTTSWLALDDYETRDFLEMAHASVILVEVKTSYDNNGQNKNEQENSSGYELFLVRIVPPQYIEAKKEYDESEEFRKKMLKDFEASLKEAETERISDEGGGQKELGAEVTGEKIEKRHISPIHLEPENHRDLEEIRILPETARSEDVTVDTEEVVSTSNHLDAKWRPRQKTMFEWEQEMEEPVFPSTYELIEHAAEPNGLGLHWLLRCELGNGARITQYWLFTEDPTAVTTTAANNTTASCAGQSKKESLLETRLISEQTARIGWNHDRRWQPWNDCLEPCCKLLDYTILESGEYQPQFLHTEKKILDFEGPKMAGRYLFTLLDKKRDLWQFTALRP